MILFTKIARVVREGLAGKRLISPLMLFKLELAELLRLEELISDLAAGEI